ncbi:hypothetical protein ACHQM5_000262 [Ranunculus cassubicifolius]
MEKTKSRHDSHVRNWPDLPRDVMLMILMKLWAVELDYIVARVCRMWREVARDPILFQSINFEGIENYITDKLEFRLFAKRTVDKSGGQLVHLSFNTSFYLDDVFDYLVVSNSLKQLKSLKLGPKSFICGDKIAVQFYKNVPSLEELDLDTTYFSIPKVRRSCHKLKNLRYVTYVHHCIWYSFNYEVDNIVQSMPLLCSLTLRKCYVTNEGLQRLLDGCPNLEYLDLRHCSVDKVTEIMRNTCVEKIKNCWFPDNICCN